jgi:hypothetical protein
MRRLAGRPVQRRGRGYGAGRRDHPNIWQIRTDLPEVRDDDISETILSFVIAGLVRRAPRPCGCPGHAGA